MNRFIVGMPGMSGGIEEESILRGRHPFLSQLVEQSQVFRLSPRWNIASWLGLDLSEKDLAPGPLLLAALRVFPPERSVQFCVTVGNLDENGLLQDIQPFTADEIREISSQFSKLNTSSLTLVEGRGQSHGLVWEQGSIDLGTVNWSECLGKHLSDVLPEGDGERALRNFIDDSLNLLDGLELNRRRHGEGLPKLNILWPWGFGFRPEIPNLPLRRGLMAEYFAPGWMLGGLVRLAAYSENVTSILKGVHISESAWNRFFQAQVGVMISPKSHEMRKVQRFEELDFECELFERSLEPLYKNRLDHPFRLIFAAPSIAGEGLAFVFDSSAIETNTLPFDERVLEDSRVKTVSLSELIAENLMA